MEVLVFDEMRRRGLHFQRHYARAPGVPDIARPRKKIAIFLDGDFWHGRDINRVIDQRGADSDWVKKLQRNIERDAQNNRDLAELGWSVLRVWDSDLRRKSTRPLFLDRIETTLRCRDEVG